MGVVPFRAHASLGVSSYTGGKRPGSSLRPTAFAESNDLVVYRSTSAPCHGGCSAVLLAEATVCSCGQGQGRRIAGSRGHGSRFLGTFFYFIYYLTRLQSQKSKLWSFLAVRVLALSRPEVSASSYKQRTKRERGERRKKNMYSQFRKTARCLDERSSKLGLFKSHDQ